MKKWVVTMVIMVLSIVWTAAGLAAEIRYEVGVDGLACPFCAYGIEKKLSSIDGVQEIAVNVTQGLVIVTMAREAQLSEQLARQKVKDAGFSVRSFVRVVEGP